LWLQKCRTTNFFPSSFVAVGPVIRDKHHGSATMPEINLGMYIKLNSLPKLKARWWLGIIA
jgi:hypothetical protein